MDEEMKQTNDTPIQNPTIHLHRQSHLSQYASILPKKNSALKLAKNMNQRCQTAGLTR